MSLLPSCSTAAAFGGIPVLFLEARVQCNPGEVITQMGLSLNADNVDVSMLTRTSGVLLVAGVGSYCAYRLCRRYLGKDFVWTMLDAAKCDLLARADSRLLHPAGEGYYDAHGNQEFRHQLLRDILDTTTPISRARSISASEQRGRTAVEYTVVSSNGKVVRVIRGDPLKRSLRSPDSQQGFATLPSPDSTSSPSFIRRRGSDALSTSSVLTSVSRPRRQNRELRSNDDPPSEVFDDAANMSGSEYSASLRLVWDGEPAWDDEFAEGDDFDGRSIAASDVSTMSAIKRLQQMLQSGDSEQPSTSSTFPCEGDSESVAGDVAGLLARCSMQGSSYLYQSVVVPVTDLAPSEVASICSGVSSRSNLSTLRARLKGQSRGLWEITSHDSPEKETAYASSEKELTPTGGEQSSRRLHPGDSHGLRTPMTDSCISRSSVSSSEIAKSRSPSGKSHARHSLGCMVDSAIVTDFVSSEDESSSTCGGSSTTSKQRLVRQSKEGVIRSAWLDRINEKPSPQHRAHSRISRTSERSYSVASEVSLEWCDHGFQDNPDDVAQQTPRADQASFNDPTNE